MKKLWKKSLALGLSFFMILEAPFSFPASWQKSFGAERAANVKATSLNVRSGPGTGYSIVGKLPYGAAVTVLSEEGAGSGTWYQIRFTGSGGNQVSGYVLSDYIQFPAAYTSDADFEAYLNSQGFPESYRPGLRELHAKYPQWIFAAVDTGLDWNEVIQNESLVGRNLVSSSSISSWKSTADGAYDWGSGTWPGFDGSSWVAASEDIIRYYMDPRNFLNETYIFQFLGQNYDPSIHTREGLAALVQGTFLGNSAKVSQEAGTGADAGPGAGLGGSTDQAGNGSSQPSGGSSSVTAGYGPGYENPTAGSQNGNLGNGETGKMQGTDSGVSVGTPPGGSAAGSGGSSGGNPSSQTGISQQAPQKGSGGLDIEVGMPPGKNISSTGSSGLSSSRHQVDAVGATVIRVGPGEEGTSSAGGTADPSAAQPPASSGGSLSGDVPYVDILMQAAVQSNVNPYVLAAMILQEQGVQGKSESISGASGYYNFFNFEAYASNGMTAVQRGLWYASQPGDYMRPWNSIDKAIIGGACQYGQNYVQAGQNTFYLKKFNVQGNNLYRHQYMTNVEGAAAEGAKMAQAYSETMRQSPMRFMIPVYRNMPEESCARPALDGSPNNKLSLISIDGFTLNPAFHRDTHYYEVSVNPSVSSVMLRASAIDSGAQIAGAGNISLTGAVTDAKLLVTAQNGTVREYTVRIIRSDGASSGNGGTGQAAGGTAAGNSQGSAAGTENGPGGSSSGSTEDTKNGQGGTSQSQPGPGGSNVTIVY